MRVILVILNLLIINLSILILPYISNKIIVHKTRPKDCIANDEFYGSIFVDI